MAATIAITIKGITSTYTSPMSDDETAEILELFIKDTIGPTPPEANTPAKVGRYKLDHALMELVLYLRRKTAANGERDAEVEVQAIRERIRGRANF